MSARIQTPPAAEVFASPREAAVAECIVRGDEEQIRKLISEGADVNIRGKAGTTLLHWAAWHRRADSVPPLLALGADPALQDDLGETALHVAARDDDGGMLRALLAGGADPNVREGRRGRTPLFDAIQVGQHARFEELLRTGADTEARDRGGQTALHLAASLGEHGFSLRLLECGADPAAADQFGQTFRRYLEIGPSESTLSAERRSDRDRLLAWLRKHDAAHAF